jgi:hypothetical protein
VIHRRCIVQQGGCKRRDFRPCLGRQCRVFLGNRRYTSTASATPSSVRGLLGVAACLIELLLSSIARPVTAPLFGEAIRLDTAAVTAALSWYKDEEAVGNMVTENCETKIRKGVLSHRFLGFDENPNAKPTLAFDRR